MWIAKKGTATVATAPKAQLPAPSRALHIAHDVETDIATFLSQNGRLEMRTGRQLMNVTASTRNADGSVDYLVRSRVNPGTILERNFQSHIRVYADNRLKLIR